MSKYLEQYERMKRLHGRLKEHTFQLPAELSGQSLIDDGLAFFQSCLHLRDWIANDEKLPQSVRDAARPYVKASWILSLCHDIAIGAKHLTVDRPLAPGENPRLNPVHTIDMRTAETFEDPNRPPGLPAGSARWGRLVLEGSVRLVLETSGGEIGALLFASDCIKEWDAFFNLHGLK